MPVPALCEVIEIAAVKSRDQAVAIGLSEARREGGKFPSRRTAKKGTARTRAGGSTKTTRKGAARKGAKKR
jgi:hypothetical protein